MNAGINIHTLIVLVMDNGMVIIIKHINSIIKTVENRHKCPIFENTKMEIEMNTFNLL